MYRHIEDHDQRPFTVKLNGNPVTDCIWADDGAGTVVLYAHDRQGNRIACPAPDPDRDIIAHNGFETVRCHGSVEIICGPGPTPNTDGQYEFGDLNYCCALEKVKQKTKCEYDHLRQVYNIGEEVIPQEWMVKYSSAVIVTYVWEKNPNA